MQDQAQTTELSLSQLVASAGLTGATMRDETLKIPGEIDAMIAKATAQLESVTGQIDSIDEMSRRLVEARAEKVGEKDRLHKQLVGLHDAKAAMAKP